LRLDGDVVLVLGAEREGLPARFSELLPVTRLDPSAGRRRVASTWALAGAIALYELAGRRRGR
jgi:hypothetical protein